MKTINKIFFTLTLLACIQSKAQVGIGTTSPNSAAILEISSTTKGFLPPRMTASQRNAISSPVAGLEIWCTDCGTYGETQIYIGSTWRNLLGGASAGVITAGTSTTGGSNPVVIGASSASGSAQLELVSTTKGFLMPRMTYSQRNAISVSASTAGLQVFCTDCSSAGQMQVYNGSAWTNMIGATPVNNFTCGSNVTFTYNGSSVTYGTVSISYSNGSKCWLDRNLGASRVAIAANDPYGYGDLFQWGRANDLHQLRSQTSMVGISGTTSTQSTTNNPGHGNFIIGNSDWRSTQNNNLWQGLNGINNPCPTGFRIPTNDDFTAEKSTWGSNKTNSAFSSTLKLPLTGYRSTSGSVYNSFGNNDAAEYWTSTVTLSNSTYYVNKFEFFGLNEYFYQNTDRAMGCAIRCITD